MIAATSVHQALFQLPPQSQSPSAIAAENTPLKPSPTPAIEHAGKRINGIVAGQESVYSKQQTEQSSTANNEFHETDDAKPSADPKLKLLSEAERQQVEEMSQRDREVRTHEAAHLAAAGQHATSGAKYTYSRGPDGRSYAVAGSVDIDTSAEVDPQATIRKADQIRRAALAPAEPSSQDRAIAAQATSIRLQAQSDLVERKTQERREVNQSEAEKNAKSGPLVSSSINSSVDSKSDQVDQALFDNHQDVKNSEELVTACEVCGGKHGSEVHAAANQNKINSNYLGQLNTAAISSARIDFIV